MRTMIPQKPTSFSTKSRIPRLRLLCPEMRADVTGIRVLSFSMWAGRFFYGEISVNFQSDTGPAAPASRVPPGGRCSPGPGQFSSKMARIRGA